MAASGGKAATLHLAVRGGVIRERTVLVIVPSNTKSVVVSRSSICAAYIVEILRCRKSVLTAQK